jgi:hypothetical protein
MEPNWPHQYVIRFEADGKRVSQGIQFDLGLIDAALVGLANQAVFISRHSREGVG